VKAWLSQLNLAWLALYSCLIALILFVAKFALAAALYWYSQSASDIETYFGDSFSEKKAKAIKHMTEIERYTIYKGRIL
jgi:hypothetical protein